MKNRTYYMRMFACLAGAMVLSHLSLAVFFPSRTPLIRSDLSLYLKSESASILTNAYKLIPRFNPVVYVPSVPLPSSSSSSGHSQISVVSSSNIATGVREELASQTPRNSSPGVYVSNNTKSNLTVLKQKEAKWTIQNYVVDGRKVQIRIPAGHSAPPTDLIEQAFR